MIDGLTNCLYVKFTVRAVGELERGGGGGGVEGLHLSKRRRYWFFEGAYFPSFWTKFCVSKWVGFYNKNSLKHEDNSLTEQLPS